MYIYGCGSKTLWVYIKRHDQEVSNAQLEDHFFSWYDISAWPEVTWTGGESGRIETARPAIVFTLDQTSTRPYHIIIPVQRSGSFVGPGLDPDHTFTNVTFQAAPIPHFYTNQMLDKYTYKYHVHFKSSTEIAPESPGIKGEVVRFRSFWTKKNHGEFSQQIRSELPWRARSELSCSLGWKRPVFSAVSDPWAEIGIIFR